MGCSDCCCDPYQLHALSDDPCGCCDPYLDPDYAISEVLAASDGTAQFYHDGYYYDPDSGIWLDSSGKGRYLNGLGIPASALPSSKSILNGRDAVNFTVAQGTRIGGIANGYSYRNDFITRNSNAMIVHVCDLEDTGNYQSLGFIGSSGTTRYWARTVRIDNGDRFEDQFRADGAVFDTNAVPIAVNGLGNRLVYYYRQASNFETTSEDKSATSASASSTLTGTYSDGGNALIVGSRAFGGSTYPMEGKVSLIAGFAGAGLTPAVAAAIIAKIEQWYLYRA